MTSPVSPELQSKILAWRSSAAAGTITLEEMKEAIIALRSGRRSAAEASAASGKKKKTPVDTGALLLDLEKI